ncbi:HIRAN domain-containing protein [Alloalcanivorax sp. C16-1]|uniref:HIRAN domain-containing protein n=1 Tax=Alloalcanivorax sp. C16-1 TaxID=3390051 RepID=UPI00397098D3
MGNLLLLAIIAIAVALIIRKNRKTRSPYEAHIRSTGRFDINVAGESFYQEALIDIEARLGRGWDDEGLQAFIVPEDDNPHDRNACGVYIDGEKVGHLSRENAREFRKKIGGRLLRDHSHFGVRARLVGGQPDKPSFGVILDMPAED